MWKSSFHRRLLPPTYSHAVAPARRVSTIVVACASRIASGPLRHRAPVAPSRPRRTTAPSRRAPALPSDASPARRRLLLPLAASRRSATPLLRSEPPEQQNCRRLLLPLAASRHSAAPRYAPTFAHTAHLRRRSLLRNISGDATAPPLLAAASDNIEAHCSATDRGLIRLLPSRCSFPNPETLLP
ncbi:hypothetical protein U1Q18_044541 [Sarracenia purpurea var. burkii]